ncbi:MAG TPA: AsmA family protein [Steroidobacteraceae bacterium]|nr:AsmA family protein [Steroidobacteraceae bacterium]
MPSLKTALKWISWVLAGLTVLVLLTIAVVVLMVDPNSFKSRIESTVRDATGREFTLVGDIDLKFFPWLALRTGEGRFGNPAGFPDEPMASWRNAQLGVKLVPLLSGDLEVDRIRLEGADVRLTLKADGTANWQGITGNEPADPNAKSRHLTINGVDLKDSRITFVDEGTPRRIAVTALDLTTGDIAPDEPFTDTEIAGNLHMDGFPEAGVPFRLEVPKVVLSEDYSQLDVGEYQLQFGAFEGKGNIGGSLDEPLTLKGAIDTNAFDLRALLASVGIEAPKTTDPKALGKVELVASWRFEGGATNVDPLALTLDDTRFTGKFSRGAGEDPVGDFTLRGDTMNIGRYIPPTDPASEPFVLPAAALKALKFRGVLELEQATYDDIVMKGVTLRLVLDEQGLRSPPAQAAKS